MWIFGHSGLLLRDHSSRCGNRPRATVRVRAKKVPAVAVAGPSWIQEIALRGFDSQSVVETIRRGLWFLILPKRAPHEHQRGEEERMKGNGREGKYLPAQRFNSGPPSFVPTD